MKFGGMFGKMLYAFIWQEWMFKANFFLLRWVNKFGAHFMPSFNSLMNKLTQFHHSDQNLQNSGKLYPGDEWCRETEPHSKWHE